jgi:hypothetical protein
VTNRENRGPQFIMLQPACNGTVKGEDEYRSE